MTLKQLFKWPCAHIFVYVFQFWIAETSNNLAIRFVFIAVIDLVFFGQIRNFIKSFFDRKSELGIDSRQGYCASECGRNQYNCLCLLIKLENLSIPPIKSYVPSSVDN